MLQSRGKGTLGQAERRSNIRLISIGEIGEIANWESYKKGLTYRLQKERVSNLLKMRHIQMRHL